MTEEIEICNKCNGSKFYLNESLYPKCTNCGNDLSDVIKVEVS